MKVLPNDQNTLCSVTELAKTLGLSRARFYQLQKKGIFPMPIYCIRTRRPFYTPALRQICVDIRKTGIGHNGQPIVFNARHKRGAKEPKDQSEQRYQAFADTLVQMGLNVTCNKVKIAVQKLYPDGLAQSIDEEKVIRDLFRYFKRQQ